MDPYVRPLTADKENNSFEKKPLTTAQIYS